MLGYSLWAFCKTFRPAHAAVDANQFRVKIFRLDLIQGIAILTLTRLA